MSHITIRFIGLCIHLGKVNLPDLVPNHRVILLGFGGGDLWDKTVNAHWPRMLHGDEEPVPLRRVRLSVANPKRAGFSRHPTFIAAVPHLDDKRKLMPKDGVLYAGNLPVQAYFDAEDGELHACRVNKGPAIGTWLKVETEGDPIIQVTGLDSNDVRQWKFAHRSVIGIHNVATGTMDSPNDYLINYLAFDEMTAPPPPPPIPDPTIEMKDCPEVDLDLELTSSCSNTGFP